VSTARPSQAFATATPFRQEPEGRQTPLRGAPSTFWGERYDGNLNGNLNDLKPRHVNE